MTGSARRQRRVRPDGIASQPAAASHGGRQPGEPARRPRSAQPTFIRRAEPSAAAPAASGRHRRHAGGNDRTSPARRATRRPGQARHDQARQRPAVPPGGPARLLRPVGAAPRPARPGPAPGGRRPPARPGPAAGWRDRRGPAGGAGRAEARPVREPRPARRAEAVARREPRGPPRRSRARPERPGRPRRSRAAPRSAAAKPGEASPVPSPRARPSSDRTPAGAEAGG